MIYRNSPNVKDVVWTRDENPEGVSLSRKFLAGEGQLLRLIGNTSITTELQGFLDLTAELPVSLFRSASGNLLLQAERVRESLMITGKTAEVLRAYIDDEPVRMQDRLDMTTRRQSDLRP